MKASYLQFCGFYRWPLEKLLGGSWSFAMGQRLWPEMHTMKQILELLMLEQFLTFLSQESHSRVQSCKEAVTLRVCAERACETEGIDEE